MRLRHKLLLVMGSASLLTVTALYLVGSILLLRGYLVLERRDALASLRSIVAVTQHERAELDRQTVDWSMWDDTYRFLKGQNPSFVDRNLKSDEVCDLGLDLLLLTDLQGQPVLYATPDAGVRQRPNIRLIGREALPLAQLVKAALAAPAHAVAGLLALPRGIAIISFQQVLASDESGPCAGYMLQGRLVSGELLSAMSAVANGVVTIIPQAPLSNASFASWPAASPTVGPFTIRAQSRHEITAQAVLRDAFGQPSLALELTTPRDVLLQGRRSLHYVVLALTLLTASLLCGVLVLQDRLVISRLGQLRANLAEVRREGSTQRQVSVSGHDEIAELAEAINETLAAQEATEQLRQLSRHLVEVQEGEQRRIAMELHDEIGQLLTGLRLLLQDTPGLTDEVLQQRQETARSLAGELMRRVRQMSLDLRPAMLEDLGLLPALEGFVKRFSAQTGVAVMLEADDLDRELPHSLATSAYRITQEALTNVARHAEVAEARVELRTDGATLRVVVRDEGKGFDPGAQDPASSIGITGMQERAAACGGAVRVISRPGRGTTVEAQMPLGDENLRRGAAN